MNRPRDTAGFTLVELIVVIVIIGVIAGVLVIMLPPAFQSYVAVGKRANLSQQADTALRRVIAEVRTAVPNSLRVVSALPGCLEMVPTSDGGRFRTGVDPAGGSMPLDLTQPTQIFDVLTKFTTTPGAGDWVVIGNQNTDDLYAASKPTREQISTVAAPPSSSLGMSRITLTAPKQFPYGYEEGRFVIVPDKQQAVTYYCSNPGVSAGTGTGTLYRYSHYGFKPTQSTCQPAGANRATVATKVQRCDFLYKPSLGATQQSGFVQVQMTLTDGGESVTLTVGAQVENVP